MENGMRHELKYLISASAAELLRRRLPCIMQRDPHAGPTGQYTIRSLYFDDFSSGAYYEKIDGVCDRLKYRIRLYNYDTSFLKLECKEKKSCKNNYFNKILHLEIADSYLAFFNNF